MAKFRIVFAASIGNRIEFPTVVVETDAKDHNINFHFTDKELTDTENLIKANGYESCSVLNIIPIDE